MAALIIVSIFIFEYLFGGPNGPNPELIMWLIGSTVFAAIVLRAVIVWLGCGGLHTTCNRESFHNNL
ncbi:MAG TPA: hypothetical protein VKA94_05200 [Hyphomicrobiales bacterium]|nr:hypothetical protein [Hyphomicrobiales bacterium]